MSQKKNAFCRETSVWGIKIIFSLSLCHAVRNPWSSGPKKMYVSTSTSMPFSSKISMPQKMWNHTCQLFLKPNGTTWNQLKSWSSPFPYKTRNIRQNLNHGLKFLKTKNTTKPETSKKSSQISAQKWPPTKSQSAWGAFKIPSHDSQKNGLFQTSTC